MATDDIPDNDPSPEADPKRQMKLSAELLNLITVEANRSQLTREEWLLNAVQYYRDRAHCGYLVENLFLLRELAALGFGVEQLTISNRLVAESVVALEGAALKALIQTAVATNGILNGPANGRTGKPSTGV